MSDMDKGIYSKYHVTKADGTPLDGDCFVLRPDRDAAAVKAMLAYAASTPNEDLSSDIRIWLASIGADMSVPDEIAALKTEVERLRAENKAYKADVEAGRLVRLPYLPGDQYYQNVYYAPVPGFCEEYYRTIGPKTARESGVLWLARNDFVFKTEAEARAALERAGKDGRDG